MLDCLIGYIGLSFNVSGEVQSGLYADALPDISEAHITKLVDGEKDVNELWNEIERRAILRFRTMFIRQVNETHQINDPAKCDCLIENNKHLLATSLWYMIGDEIMNTRMRSSRMNTYTTIDKGKAREMRDDFRNLFERELEMAVNGINVHTSPCFDSCNQPEPRDAMSFVTPII